MRNIAIVVLAGLVAVASPRPAAATQLFQRLDPRLSAALVPGSEPVPVWIDFVDKGEQGPADLQRRLAEAERGLTPAARARRVRAGLHPLVDFLDLPVAPGYLAELEARGYRPYGASRWLNGCCVRTSGQALAALGGLDFVRRLSPAPLARVRRPEPADLATELALSRPIGAASLAGTPSFYGQTYWELQRLAVPAVHDSGYIGTGVTIAMLDDGFNYYTKHEATRNIDVVATRDFVRGIESVQDTLNSPCYLYFMHGQYTLSCIGGNAPGIFVGPAYGARFALAHTEDDCSEMPVEMVNWLNASEWADSLGADVISSSLGYMTFDSSAYNITPSMLDGHTTIITRAVEIAASKGIVVVNSAGNSGPAYGTLDAPADACGDSMLTVGAVDSSGVITGFSSRGPTADGRTKPDVCAQGRADLLASASGSVNGYVYASGTSFSCPLTAGLMACLLQARPTWSPMLVLRALKMTSNNAATPNNDYGWGVPNGLAALRWTPDTAGVPAGGPAFEFALGSANPLRASDGGAIVRFRLAQGESPSAAKVVVYDLGGRRVRTLWSGVLPPGQLQQARWDGSDAGGRAQSPGLYFIALEAPEHHAVLRLALLR